MKTKTIEYYKKYDSGKEYNDKRYGGQVGSFRKNLVIVNFLSTLNGVPLKGKKILEIAPGTGVITRWLLKRYPDIHMTAIDSSSEMLSYLKKVLKRENLKSKLIEADAIKLPFENNTFDFVFALRLLLHYPTPKPFLKEMERVVKPGGAVLTDCHNILRLDFPNTFYRRFVNPKGFRGKVNSYYLFPWEISKRYSLPTLHIIKIQGHKFLPPNELLIKVLGENKLIQFEKLIGASWFKFFCADNFILLKKAGN